MDLPKEQNQRDPKPFKRKRGHGTSNFFYEPVGMWELISIMQ
jgi:hypothetical protein